MQSMICSFGKLRSSSADKLSTFSNVKFIFFHQKNSDSIHQTSSISLFNSKHKRQINLARKMESDSSCHSLAAVCVYKLARV